MMRPNSGGVMLVVAAMSGLLLVGAAGWSVVESSLSPHVVVAGRLTILALVIIMVGLIIFDMLHNWRKGRDK